MVELIIVIVLVAILASGSSFFIGRLIEGYTATQRRGELTDIADGALRRMGRDIKTALPMSVRVATSGTTTYIEFLATKAGGRYKYNAACFASSGCSSLTTIGNVNDGSWTFVPGVDRLSLWSQDFGTALNCAAGDISAWCAGTAGVTNWAPVITGFGASGSEQSISFSSTVFSGESDQASSSFRVIDGPVTYVCNPAAGTLSRYWGYSLPQPAQWTTTPPSGSSSAIIANRVTGCQVAYDANASAQQGLLGRGVISIRLTLSLLTESVSLVHQIHVNNAP